MKKLNAFAFRDFDMERILQRPFFKEFHFDADKSDAQILQVLKSADSDSFEMTQHKFDSLDSLLVRVAEYQEHLKRHGERLTKYARRVATKIATDDNADVSVLRARHKRAGELSMKYCGCISDTNGTTTFFLGGIAVDNVGGLIEKIVARYKELDEKVKIHYRKIFATRLKQARKERGLTQEELGKCLNISQRAIGNYENSTREPSIAMLIRMSQKLKRPIDWLVGAI